MRVCQAEVAESPIRVQVQSQAKTNPGTQIIPSAHHPRTPSLLRPAYPSGPSAASRAAQRAEDPTPPNPQTKQTTKQCRGARSDQHRSRTTGWRSLATSTHRYQVTRLLKNCTNDHEVVGGSENSTAETLRGAAAPFRPLLPLPPISSAFLIKGWSALSTTTPLLRPTPVAPRAPPASTRTRSQAGLRRLSVRAPASRTPRLPPRNGTAALP